MGNCGSAPKTSEESNVPAPEPAKEESVKDNEEAVKGEQVEKTIEATCSDKKKNDADDSKAEEEGRKSLGDLLVNEVQI